MQFSHFTTLVIVCYMDVKCFNSMLHWERDINSYSYNGALRRLLLIKKSYSAGTMFVTHGIPSFF